MLKHMQDLTFKQRFFRIYDQKINSGEITFLSSGIKKDTFNRLCNDRNFVPTEQEFNMLARGLKLNAEEIKELKNAIHTA